MAPGQIFNSLPLKIWGKLEGTRHSFPCSQERRSVSDYNSSFQWSQRSCRSTRSTRCAGARRNLWGKVVFVLWSYTLRGQAPQLPSMCVREGQMYLPVTEESQQRGTAQWPRKVTPSYSAKSGALSGQPDTLCDLKLTPYTSEWCSFFWTGMAVSVAIYLSSGMEPRKLQQFFFLERV